VRKKSREIEGIGYAAGVVEDGREAEAIDCRDYDLIPIDFQMPVMNGNQATARYDVAKDPVRPSLGNYPALPSVTYLVRESIARPS
jgi:CheY-like chemotaxis protein